MADVNNLNYLTQDATTQTLEFWPLGHINAVGVQQTADAPVAQNFSPATGTAVSAETPISLEVVGDWALRRIVVLVQFPSLNIYDVAWDGSALGNKYRGALNASAAISGGRSFTLLRDGGWPSSPRIVPIAIDQLGNENPVESVTYGWTLA